MSAADALPYDPGPALTRREVEQELVELGFAPEDAPRMLADYLDETSARVGVRVDDWALDFADVDAIADTYTHRAPGDHVRGRADAIADGDQGEADAAIACAAAAAAAAEVAARADTQGDVGDAGVTPAAGIDMTGDEDGQAG